MTNATPKAGQPQPASATVTITEMSQGVVFDVKFNTPYEKGDPTLAHLLALKAIDELRRFLKEKFENAQEEMHVVRGGKVH